MRSSIVFILCCGIASSGALPGIFEHPSLFALNLSTFHSIWFLFHHFTDVSSLIKDGLFAAISDGKIWFNLISENEIKNEKYSILI